MTKSIRGRRTAWPGAGLALIFGLAASPGLAQQVPAPVPDPLPAPVATGSSSSAAAEAVAPEIGMLARTGESGLMFELHQRYYQITGPVRLYSADARFNAARLRLFELFKQEWSGYQGILRTGVYASNDGMAHLVAGKQVELLSDEQVAMLLVRHLPAEAPQLVPPEVLLALPVESVAASAGSAAAVAPVATAAARPAVGGSVATVASRVAEGPAAALAAVESMTLLELVGAGAVGVAVAAAGLYWSGLLPQLLDGAGLHLAK